MSESTRPAVNPTVTVEPASVPVPAPTPKIENSGNSVKIQKSASAPAQAAPAVSAKSNKLWWIMGGLAVLGAAFFIFRKKAGNIPAKNTENPAPENPAVGEFLR